MTKYLSLALTAIAIVMAGCAHQAGELPDVRLAAADNDFAVSLYKEIAKKDAGTNIVICPVSVAQAIQLTYNGAAGSTGEAMAGSLGLKGMSITEINRANSRLIANLESENIAADMSVTKAIGGTSDFRPQFSGVARDDYRAEVRRLPKTAGMTLTTAGYFHGQWLMPFPKSLTREGDFHLPDGRIKRVPMMHREQRLMCCRVADASVIKLPYGTGRLSMCIILPDEGTSLDRFSKGLDADKLARWAAGVRRSDYGLYLPRFDVEWAGSLNRQLKALGMKSAFDPDRADFRHATASRAWINGVSHKARIEVDEGGRRAAMAIRMGPKFSMVVDRPFVFVIRDDKSTQILFLGSVVDPTKN